MRLFFLGPQGSFTHQAAQTFAQHIDEKKENTQCELVACSNERAVFEAVESGRGYGVIAWENNVEGYVAQNLDALIDAHNVIAISRTSVDIIFDAYVLPKHGELHNASAHPHGLAQCTSFIQSHSLSISPAQSNAAACERLDEHSVAFAPRGCGELYGLIPLDQAVQDYDGAHTDFLLLAPRDNAFVNGSMRQSMLEKDENYESVLTVIPLSTGPGVIANLMDVFRDNGLNMTSLISRPIKAVDGTYSFIITLDAAPWNASMTQVMQEIEEHGDWLKTLAVYKRRDVQQIPVAQWNLPHRGVDPNLSSVLKAK